MKNVGIITFHRAENYGSALQAYALNKYIQTTYDTKVETIDYFNKVQESMYKFFQANTSPLNIIRNLHTLLYYKSLKKKKVAFQNFISDNIPLSEFHGDDYKKLQQYAHKYDACICGSDQIWNIHCADQDSVYFLSFATNNKKIAYAPSLGPIIYGKEETDVFKKYLFSFKSLSVREEDAALFLKNILPNPVKIVADPVFLLSKEHWESIASCPIKKKYILCYFIGDDPGMRNFAKKVQKTTGLPVIVILKNLRDIRYRFNAYYSGGPLEFLGLIKNAEYVITSSFHAIAFSIIFRKNFWGFAGNTLNPNNRIINICNITDLKERILDAKNWRTCNYDKNIDYDRVKHKLDNFIRHSKTFIENALSD